MMGKDELCLDRAKVETSNGEDDDEIEAVMDLSLYQAALNGDKNCFLQADDANEECYLRTTHHNNNIIHVSVQHEQFEFAEVAAKRLPELMHGINMDGNNPLHIAAEIGNFGVVEKLVDCCRRYNGKSEANQQILPWRGKNKEGNTPLHAALIHRNLKVACYLVDLDPTLARFSNNFKETPLHLAVRYRIKRDKLSVRDDIQEKDSISVIELLLRKDRLVACWHDSKGLTPLFTALMLNPPYLEALEAMLRHCPESAEKCDYSGSSILHLISKCKHYDWFDVKILLGFPSVRVLKNKQDDAGDTPMHIAAANQNVYMILYLHKLSTNLKIENKQGVSGADLIQQQPQEFQRDIKQEIKYGYRWNFDRCDPLSETEIEAIREMDWKSLRKTIEEIGSTFFHKKDRSDNILHIFMERESKVIGPVESEEFIKLALENSPALICQIGSSGYNVLQIIVLEAPTMINGQLLSMIKHCYELLLQEACVEELCYDPPWKAKDQYGNTPLHLALQAKGYWEGTNPGFEYIKCARELLDFDSELASEANDNGEIPLHLVSEASQSAIEELDTGNVIVTELLDNVKFIISKSGHEFIKKLDCNGRTPLERAFQNEDLHCIRLMHHKFNIFDFTDIIDSEHNTPWHLLAKINVLDESYEQLLDSVSQVIAIDICLTRANKDGNMPFHLAIMNDNFKLPQFIFDTNQLDGFEMQEKGNNDGDTLLHLAIGKSDSQDAKNFIRKVYCSVRHVIKANNDGNTPLHLAILKGDLEFGKIIFDMFGSQATELSEILEKVDKDQNTPLHLATLIGKFEFANMFFDRGEAVGCIEEILHKANAEGNTPLHLTILNDNFDFANTIIDQFKSKEKYLNQLLEATNKDLNTPVHLAILKGEFRFAYKFIETVKESNYFRQIPEMCNKEGDTILHLAIKKREFGLARKFIEYATTTSCIGKILDTCNNKDETPGGLLGSDTHLPDEFEKFFWKKPEVVQAMLGVRSLSGISTKIIKEYTGTIGVIAALFATITFTAAFTVPGGLNSNHGTPLLVRKPTFQVFMVFDILALCLSMMALFCLLWIMTVGNKKHQVLLLDLTVLLLEASFYATIMTFMMGLFVTVFPVKSWIAILACVLCTLLILLMRKRFIVGFIPCFIRMYVLFQKFYSRVRELSERMLCFSCERHQKNEEENKNLSQPNEHAEQGEIAVNVVEVKSN